MIQQQESRVKSGSTVVHLGAKKHARVVQKSRSCSLFYFDIRGVVHDEYVTQGQTVNAAFYVEVLKRLECVQCVQPELLAGKNWILQHDNASLLSALIVCEFFAKNEMIITDHPSYSLDLTPWNFPPSPPLKWKRLRAVNILGL
jgi:hypothetical protein